MAWDWLIYVNIAWLMSPVFSCIEREEERRKMREERKNIANTQMSSRIRLCICLSIAFAFKLLLNFWSQQVIFIWTGRDNGRAAIIFFLVHQKHFPAFSLIFSSLAGGERSLDLIKITACTQCRTNTSFLKLLNNNSVNARSY